MDVKCERCNTEYEFDDALVSGRGTTVKCTNCGHKFKIRRGDGDLADDYWNITTGDGRTLVFTSLRELQRAIQGYLVERNDRLSRGGLPPKPIGSIPELTPFFDQREAAKATGANRSIKTQDGIGPAAQAVVNNAQVRPRQLTRPDYPPPPESHPIGDEEASNPGKSTLIGTGPLSEQEAIPRPGPAAVQAPPAPPPRAKMNSVPPPVPTRLGREPMATQPMARPQMLTPPPIPTKPPPPVPSQSPKPPPAVSKPPPVPDKRPSASPVQAAAPAPGPSQSPSRPEGQIVIKTVPPPAPAPSPPTPQRKVSAPPPAPEPPRPIRSLRAQIEEERDRREPYESVPELPQMQRRRPVGGFIVAVVVIGAVLTMGAVWAQKNLGGLGTKPTASTPQVDPRVASFLVAGEKALADGNLDLAKESFDKASALAEKDPHVLLSLARLAAVRADVPWLKMRLLAPDAADDQKIAKNEVTELAAAARKAADDALLVAPDDPAALRAKIDALRIAEDRDGARALVPKISSSATQPESAYVLAALDLADPEPGWPSIIERLKTASSVETGPGRGRAALVYALARSGDGAAAKAEVDRLAAMSRPHPLLPLLRVFAANAKPKGDAGAPEAADAGKGKVATTATNTTSSGGGGDPGAMPSDPRQMLLQAEKAKQKGDLEKAKSLYSAAADKNPNDSEALSGLAGIAYAQHDLDGARAAYKRVLAVNPNYMPAIVGLADVEWDSGNKDAAIKMYKDLVDRYPEGTYPARAKTRSEGS
jgi:predicted Zn finger-like uncharacterized protein